MCGDGANDCAALKEADVGLSLSNNEASVAAPFTTKLFEIKSFAYLLKEGRCALVTSFQCFKWTVIYSFIMFSSVLLLYFYGGNLADPQYMFIDMVQILPLVYFMSWNLPSSTLTPSKPVASLMDKGFVSSIFSQFLVAMVFQLIALKLVQTDSGYVPIDTLIEERERAAGYQFGILERQYSAAFSWETTGLFLVSNFMYLHTIVLYSMSGRSGEFRRPIVENRCLCGWVVLMLVLDFWMLMHFNHWVYDYIQLMDISFTTRFYGIALVIAYILSSSIMEIVIYKKLD